MDDIFSWITYWTYLLFKQIYINLDEYNDADYVNFDMAEEAQWNESWWLWG